MVPCKGVVKVKLRTLPTGTGPTRADRRESRGSQTMSRYIRRRTADHILRLDRDCTGSIAVLVLSRNWGTVFPLQQLVFSLPDTLGNGCGGARLQAVTPFRFRCKESNVIVTEDPSPSWVTTDA